MHRTILVVILVAMAAVVAVGTGPDRSAAESNTPTVTPMPASQALLDYCPVELGEGTPGPGANWRDADVRPFGRDEAAVDPAAELLDPERDPKRELFLATITLPVGGCMPTEAGGNQKDGAIVMIVQQGIVEFVWEPAFSDTTPTVKQGDSDYTDPTPVPMLTERVLYPGDWITIDQQVTFAYKNLSDESAIINKAVWAVPDSESAGSGGHK